MGLRYIILGGASAVLSAAPAFAHAGFLLPNTFTAEEDATITAFASFSDAFPAPEIALVSDSFAMTGPDGEAASFETVETFKAVTILEGTPGTPGLYRLTTGERLGRTGKVALSAGEYVRLGPDGETPDSLPDDAEILTSQTATVSESFVMVGTAERPAMLATSGRLSLMLGDGEAPLESGHPLTASFSFDGEPLSSDEIMLIDAYGHYASGEDGLALSSGENGKAALPALTPGVYVLLARHIAEAPDGAETDVRSYTTTLTFEIPGAAETGN
ncbi:DUF4198 domain-containing protein [Henriciella sp.]|uniref:DUF4198 domain-containing protein n=1 Tax=Henriciella sp. TaxID=1968823 RepID=UPI002616E77E|nr:DUF4198 domain-containing protein [Henriciella sp.]